MGWCCQLRNTMARVGPHGTCFVFLNHKLLSVWICHTYGLKFVLACKPSLADQSQSICLYDFNKLTARWDSSLPATNVIQCLDHMFDKLVYTHLPCQCSWNDLLMCNGNGYEAVMMSEDSLIAAVVGHLVHSFSSFLFWYPTLFCRQTGKSSLFLLFRRCSHSNSSSQSWSPFDPTKFRAEVQIWHAHMSPSHTYIVVLFSSTTSSRPSVLPKPIRHLLQQSLHHQARSTILLALWQ